MKVIITGAGGFIGSNIGDYFHKKGHIVVGWDTINKDTQWPILKVDMLRIDEILENLKVCSPDLIIHCAGSADVGKSISDPFLDYERNVTLTHNLFFAIHHCGLNNIRVIFLSSAAVYGNPGMLPINEDTSLTPLSPYALHKVLCENICRYFNQNYGADIKILRIFSAYGEGLKKQIFWDMYNKVKTTGKLNMLGTGNESRDYIYITDLVRAVYLITTLAPKEELVYNVANGEEITIRHATEVFAHLIGLNFDAIFFNGQKTEGNPINWKADITKLNSLGYSSRIVLEEGLKSYITWSYNQH